MAAHRVNQDTFALLVGHFNEFKDVFGGLVCRVEEHLVFLVEPEEGQVDYAHLLPLVLNLLPRAINNSSNLVHLYKVHVLSNRISHTQTAISTGYESGRKKGKLTYAANSSPIKRPSLILMAPIMSSGINICCWSISACCCY